MAPRSTRTSTEEGTSSGRKNAKAKIPTYDLLSFGIVLKGPRNRLLRLGMQHPKLRIDS